MRFVPNSCVCISTFYFFNLIFVFTLAYNRTTTAKLQCLVFQSKRCYFTLQFIICKLRLQCILFCNFVHLSATFSYKTFILFFLIFTVFPSSFQIWQNKVEQWKTWKSSTKQKSPFHASLLLLMSLHKLACLTFYYAWKEYYTMNWSRKHVDFSKSALYHYYYEEKKLKWNRKVVYCFCFIKVDFTQTK